MLDPKQNIHIADNANILHQALNSFSSSQSPATPQGLFRLTERLFHKTYVW